MVPSAHCRRTRNILVPRAPVDRRMCVFCLRFILKSQIIKNTHATMFFKHIVSLRQAKVVEGDQCGRYNCLEIHKQCIGPWLMNSLNSVTPLMATADFTSLSPQIAYADVVCFSHVAGRYRPGEPLFLSPGCRRCGYVEGFMIRE